MRVSACCGFSSTGASKALIDDTLRRECFLVLYSYDSEVGSVNGGYFGIYTATAVGADRQPRPKKRKEKRRGGE